ncbi:UNVERIFIED_CONTAM: hypothetical protein NCL1_51281 [Trichonephila clavipes]
MSLRRFRRQNEIERGRIIGMMEAERSAGRVARSGRPRQTSCREDRPIVRNTRVQPTASSEDIQAQVAPSLEAPVSFRTIRRRLAEGHLGSWRPLRVLPLTPTHRRGAAHEETGLQWNGTRSSLATNPDSISAVMTNVFVCGDPVENASILPLLYSGTLIPQLLLKYVLNTLLEISDRGKIVAYRDCGLPFRKIDCRDGQNQTTHTLTYKH